MRIRYFAWLRHRVGRAEEFLDLPPAHVASVAASAPVAPGDEVAFFPPVTGG